jgi:pantetheine-phosphate adenylyltransferase
MAVVPSRTIAVYPGSFDPVTHGHLDIIRRAAPLFAELVVGIGLNPKKETLFAPEQRKELIEPHVRHLDNVRVEIYRGLTIDFVKTMGGGILLKGIRDVNDLSHEIRQANVNSLIGRVETLFMLTGDQYVVTSSTYIKQIFELGGDDQAPIHRLVPENVVAALRALEGKSDA